MNSDQLYDYFLNTKSRQDIWNLAYKVFPEYNTEQSDEAADYIYDNFSNWLEDNEEIIGVSAEKWLSEFGEEMYESIYAGLT
jgi:hypothetical protein